MARAGRTAAVRALLAGGLGWGRLAFGLLAEIGPGLEYQGFDPYHQHVRWAQKNLASALPAFVVHLAEIANEV